MKITAAKTVRGKLMRPSRDENLMDHAWINSRRSTCSRLNVGAVFAREGRPLSMGYNGAPAGLPHCHHDWWKTDRTQEPPQWVKEFCTRYITTNREIDWPREGSYFYMNNGKVTYQAGLHAQVYPDADEACTRAEHAERNGVAFAARYGVPLEGSELFVTHMPCLPCAMSVVNAGVVRVVFDRPYRITEGIELLHRAGVVVDELHRDMIG